MPAKSDIIRIHTQRYSDGERGEGENGRKIAFQSYTINICVPKCMCVYNKNTYDKKRLNVSKEKA